MRKVLILVTTLVILALALAAYFFKFAPRPDYVLKVPSVSPWQTYTDSRYRYSISYPSDFTVVQDSQYSIRIFHPPAQSGADPVNFVYVSAFPKDTPAQNTDFLTALSALKVNQTRSLAEVDSDQDQWFTYTRLEDASISATPARLFLNSQPWNLPEGSQELMYYLQNPDVEFLIGGFIESPDPVQKITRSQFDQIVSSFKLD
ncbi:hypothetical protein A2899_04990 [Candidatus Amesbacteria bacterium RIFCSPLOWO2_01_FULL_49_25]|uniref:PsbP C-terminal domain-containing protein n=1 Tax=Candidatus Amesbacteria bacterium RIFCSPHIGHO2_01_FULL_48_32b TaxID=1797253 RepID=A0A1F4YE10_9BACT|nr:MAG: hypothetical protein A2876_04305 [Candidatus Amesbacteria bacterium RIFCSPHIGHO2_01_FULL_48_32b]OGD07936.1 MAG: hypothetical protein A2899_04990 [Candidatus Amesbacteria bacterium RIFCSPLOWO2_01_FULL_49_25]